jgi:hypothetical protein
VVCLSCKNIAQSAYGTPVTFHSAVVMWDGFFLPQLAAGDDAACGA